MTAKNATTNPATAKGRRTPPAKKTATSAPAKRAGGAARRAPAPAASRGQLPHPVVDQFERSAVALAELFRAGDWAYCSLVVVPPDSSTDRAPLVITIENPAHPTNSDG